MHILLNQHYDFNLDIDIGELGEHFCTDIYDYGKVHDEIYRITNILKYRSFQYRLLQRSLMTNLVHLFKWKIVESEKCSFCKEEKETILHMLFACKYTEQLWIEVQEEIYGRFGVHMNVS